MLLGKHSFTWYDYPTDNVQFWQIWGSSIAVLDLLLTFDLVTFDTPGYDDIWFAFSHQQWTANTLRNMNGDTYFVKQT